MPASTFLAATLPKSAWPGQGSRSAGTLPARARPTVRACQVLAKLESRTDMMVATASRREALARGLLAAVGAAAALAMRPPAADAAGAGARLSRPSASNLPAPAASPIDIVRQAYGAFGAWEAGGGADTGYAELEACFSDGIVWESNVNGGFVGVGKKGLRRFLRWLVQANEVRGFTIKEMIESGREVAVVIEHSGLGKVTGKQYSATMVHLFTIDEAGRISNFKEFVDPTAVEALSGVPFPPAAA